MSKESSEKRSTKIFYFLRQYVMLRSSPELSFVQES